MYIKAPLQAALYAVREMELRSKDYVNPQTNAKKDALGIVMYTAVVKKSSNTAVYPGRSTTDLITDLWICWLTVYHQTFIRWD